MEADSDNDDKLSPQPHQKEQQNTSQVPPSASAQAMPLGRKDHSTRRSGFSQATKNS